MSGKKQAAVLENLKNGIFDNLDVLSESTKKSLEVLYEMTANKEITLNVGLWESVRSYDDYCKIHIDHPSGEAIIEPLVETEGKRRFFGLLGPKNKKLKKRNDDGRLSFKVKYLASAGLSYSSEKAVSFDEAVKGIRDRNDIEDAKDFSKYCKKIQEMPYRIIEYMESAAKEINQSGIINDYVFVEPTCEKCGAPNRELKINCDYCGSVTAKPLLPNSIRKVTKK